MIKHHQTIFGNGEAGATPGNCLQTAVACVLDLPMEEVPHFVAMPENQWWSAFLLWLSARNLRLSMYAERFSGLQVYSGGALITGPLNAVPRSRLVLAQGESERGFRHVVLYQNGKLVHDPHPSGTGLVGEPDEVWMIDAMGAEIS